jgi:competence protein ComEC
MHEIVFSFLENHKRQCIVFLFLLFLADGILLLSFFNEDGRKSTIHFLDVGQGDAELISLESGVRALIDSGASHGLILDSLSRVLPPGTGSIDLLFVSHPEADHIGGIPIILDTYKVGAILYSGRETSSGMWKDIERKAKEKHVQLIMLTQYDKVRINDSRFDVLAPDDVLKNTKETNDSSLVLRFLDGGISALFVGDIGSRGERFLQKLDTVSADVLKVGHHGSKYSSAVSFLTMVKPSIAVIEVGKNSYGHPTPEVLSRLSDIGARVFRTDQNGIVTIELLGNGKVDIYKER